MEQAAGVSWHEKFRVAVADGGELNNRDAVGGNRWWAAGTRGHRQNEPVEEDESLREKKKVVW